MSGATSGAESSAVSPSNTPSTPPSSNPSNGFFIGLHSFGERSLRAFSSCVLASLVGFYGLAPDVGHDRAHDDVGGDDQDERAIRREKASGAIEHGLGIGGHRLSAAIAHQIGRDFSGVRVAI